MMRSVSRRRATRRATAVDDTYKKKERKESGGRGRRGQWARLLNVGRGLHAVDHDELDNGDGVVGSAL